MMRLVAAGRQRQPWLPRPHPLAHRQRLERRDGVDGAQHRAAHQPRRGEVVGEQAVEAVEGGKDGGLAGRQVAAVANFPKKQIGKFMSEVLVLGFPDENGEVVLISPTLGIPNGGRLY